MTENDPQLDYSRRERQILDILFESGEATAEQVRRRLPDPPSSSAVRTLLSRLEHKGAIGHREEDLRFVYRPLISRRAARSSAIARLVRVFFAGSRAQAVTSLLAGAEELDDDELDRLSELIEAAKKKRRES